jgi:hypothetical protein
MREPERAPFSVSAFSVASVLSVVKSPEIRLGLIPGAARQQETISCSSVFSVLSVVKITPPKAGRKLNKP